MSQVSVDAVRASYRGDLEDVADSRLVQELIDQAELKIANRVGNLEVWVGSNTLRAANLRSVVVQAVQATLASPVGPFQSEGEFSYNYAVRLNDVQQFIAITPEMWSQLGVEDAGGAGQFVGLIRTGVPSWSPRAAWKYAADSGKVWSSH